MQSYILHVILQNTVHFNPNLLSQFHRVLEFILAPAQYMGIYVYVNFFFPSSPSLQKKDGCWFLPPDISLERDALRLFAYHLPQKCYIATGISEAKDHKIFHSCNAPKVSSTPSGTRTLYFFFLLFFLFFFCFCFWFVGLFLKTTENNLSMINLFCLPLSHLQKILLWSLIEIRSLKTQSVN